MCVPTRRQEEAGGLLGPTVDLYKNTVGGIAAIDRVYLEHNQCQSQGLLHGKRAVDLNQPK